jgi:hypothetical protein
MQDQHLDVPDPARAGPGARQEPSLRPAPPEIHAGVEATGNVPASALGRFSRNVADKVTPGG